MKLRLSSICISTIYASSHGRKAVKVYTNSHIKYHTCFPEEIPISIYAGNIANMKEANRQIKIDKQIIRNRTLFWKPESSQGSYTEGNKYCGRMFYGEKPCTFPTVLCRELYSNTPISDGPWVLCSGYLPSQRWVRLFVCTSVSSAQMKKCGVPRAYKPPHSSVMHEEQTADSRGCREFRELVSRWRDLSLWYWHHAMLLVPRVKTFLI